MARRVAKRTAEDEEHQPTKVEAAQAALAKAQEELHRWERQRDQRAIDVADAERSLGQAVVKGTPADQPINKASTEDALNAAGQNLATLRAEHEAATAAVEATRKRVDRAQRDVWLAQATEVREQAAAFTAEADERAKVTDALLVQLQQHEGVEYAPKEVDTRQQVIAFGSATVSIPRTQRLRNEAAALIRQAEALEYQAASTPQAIEERAEAERQAREEAIRSTQEDNDRRYWEGRAGAGYRVVEPPVGV